MKKQLLMTAAILLLTVVAQAQTFEFRYHGEAIPDGGMVTIPAVEDDFGFGELWCETNPSDNPNNGLILKLLSGSSASGTASLTIEHNTLNPTTLKWCMGGDCSMMIGKTELSKDFSVKNGSVQVQFDAEDCKSKGYLLASLTATIGSETHSVNIQFTNGESAPLTVTRRVVVEEYTGTGCGYCPRGIVGREKLQSQYGDLYVGIVLHQYGSGDPMAIARDNYASLTFTGAPQCKIDRRNTVDPYNGSGNGIINDFAAELATPTSAGIEVEAKWNASQTKVDAKATVQSLVDGADYNIEYVLIGDGITGSEFKQKNYYYNRTDLAADLAVFGAGGQYGQQEVNLVFNDVALSSSYVSGVNQAAKLTNLSSSEPVVSQYTLSLPTNETLLNAIDKNQVYVAALLVDDSGIIVNAAKAKVQGSAGIIAPNATTNHQGDMNYYTLDGRRVENPTKGVYIQNGKKIIIK